MSKSEPFIGPSGDPNKSESARVAMKYLEDYTDVFAVGGLSLLLAFLAKAILKTETIQMGSAKKCSNLLLSSQ